MQYCLYNAQQTRAMEQLAINKHGYSGLLLMKMAAERAFANIMARFSGASPVVVLCGSGNNGGDGYVVAKCAQTIGLDVVVVQASPPQTREAIQVCQDFVDGGGITITDIANQIMALQNAGLIVDGLLGTGLNRAPSGCYADLIRATNQTLGPVIALDLPSGLASDSGFAFNPCLRATMTVTFIGAKVGLFTGAGKDYSGEIKFESLNLPRNIRQSVNPVATIIQPPQLRKRTPNSHKGDYGSIIIAGGDNGMLGAALLAGRAALRCGSGRVTVLSTDRHVDMPALHCPELMSQCIENESGFSRLCDQSDVVVIGTGLGLSDWSRRIFAALIDWQKPLVIDADGLTLLAELHREKPRKNDHWILTPHPGEAATLLGCTTAEVQKDRIGAVLAIVEQFGGVCVLKGAGTLVADVLGGVSVCGAGNAGMATAGMGDVLSGIIAAVMGQNTMLKKLDERSLDLGKVATTGVWLHSRCADKVSGKTGMTSLLAGDIIDALPEVLLALETSEW